MASDLDCDPPLDELLPRWQPIFSNILAVLDLALGAWIILSNTFALTVLLTTKRMRRPFDLHLMSLASIDLLKGLVVVPLDETRPHLQIKDNACFWIYLTECTIILTQLFVLLASTLDRYWAVIHPLHYLVHATNERTLYIILVSWVIVFITAPFSFIFRMRTEDECILQHPCFESDDMFKHHYISILGISLILPVNLAMLYLYYKILVVVYRLVLQIIERKQGSITTMKSKIKYLMNDPHSDDNSALETDKVVLKESKIMAGLVVKAGINFISWIPLVLLVLCQDSGNVRPYHFHIFAFFNHINSAVNPFMYTLRTGDRREEAVKLMEKIRFWRN